MSVQIIEKNGRPEWAVVPYEEYQRLVTEAEITNRLQPKEWMKRRTWLVQVIKTLSRMP